MALSDSFEALGLPMSATPKQVRDRWRDVAKTVHPDLGHPLSKFLAAKARMEACLDHAKKPRACSWCDGLGQKPKVRGFKTEWTECSACKGKKTVVLS